MAAALLTLNKINLEGIPASLVAIVFGVSLSWLASDLMLINAGYDRLGAHVALGMGVGTVGGSMMMVMRVVAPDLADKLIRITSKTLAGLAEIASKMILGMSESRFAKALSIIFGKDDSTKR